jgi:hypothetical protein
MTLSLLVARGRPPAAGAGPITSAGADQHCRTSARRRHLPPWPPCRPWPPDRDGAGRITPAAPARAFAALAWNITRREPEKAGADRLAELVSRDIAQELPNCPLHGRRLGAAATPALLARWLQTVPALGVDGGRIALVSPSGAGKTTTLAKLARRCWNTSRVAGADVRR